MEFIYFEEQWNERESKTPKTGSIDLPRMAPCSAHARASEEQEEVLKKEKT